MTTKRKKIVAISSSLLAVLLLAGGCIWWTVARRQKAEAEKNMLTDYRPSREAPIESDIIFPTPDSVIYRKDSAHELCAEDEAKLIAVFEKVLTTYQRLGVCRCLYDAETLRAETQRVGALEFRYAMQVNCTAEPLRERNEAPETDIIWIFLSEYGSLQFVRVFDGKVQGNGHSYILGGFPEEVREEYHATVRDVLSHYDFEKPDWLTG